MDHFDVLDLQQINPVGKDEDPAQTVDIIDHPQGGEEGNVAGRKG